MNQTAIFWPMLAHVLLIYIVYAVLGLRRHSAVHSGAAKARDYKLRATEPEASATASNNLMNQFELPVLFHVLCLALYVTNGVSYLTLALMWVFVVSRYIHAWVHMTSNALVLRRNVFLVGALVLGVCWVWFALHIAGVV